MNLQNKLDIYIVEKNPFTQEDLVKTKIEIDNKKYNTKELIASLVKFEIKRLESENKNFKVNNEDHLNKLIVLGKVGGNLNLRKGSSINVEEQIKKAYMSFEHKDYYLFVDNQEIEDLTQELPIKAKSEIIIINNIRFY